MTNLKNLTTEELDSLYNETCEIANACYYEWKDNDEKLTAKNDSKWSKATKTIEAIEEEYKNRGLI